MAASGNPPKLSVKTSSTSGWTSAGSLSSVPTEPPAGSVRNQGITMLGFSSAGCLSSVPNSQPISQPSLQAEDRGRHGDGHHQHSDRSDRHGRDDRYGDRDRHGDRDRERHGDRDRHSSSSRHSDSRNGDGRRDRDDRKSERDGGDRDDSFAVPEPPKRRKSRWDN